MNREPVVVTGMGVVAPTAIGIEEFETALREGWSGIGRIRSFDCAGFESRIAAEVLDTRFRPAGYVKPPKAIKTMSRAAQFAVVAGSLARRSSGLEPGDVDARRIAVSLGAGGMGPVDHDMLSAQANGVLHAAAESGSLDFDIPAFAAAYRAKTNPLIPLRGLPNLAAAHLAIQQEARGPNRTVATACTAGTQAIGEGARLIQSDDADVVFAGGADAMINAIGLVGFGMLGTLSRRNDEPERAARPFDRDRDGFVIGEGAAVLVLERRSCAVARGAHMFAEIAGYGATCDAYRITDERPDATGAIDAMQNALKDADQVPSDVGYINAHGTGTPMNDQTEASAVREVFRSANGVPPLSSTKSMIGHLLAAAGAVEAVATILALRGGFLPPTLNFENVDAACEVDCVPNQARAASFDLALSNSFGFGGQNACLAIRRI